MNDRILRIHFLIRPLISMTIGLQLLTWSPGLVQSEKIRVLSRFRKEFFLKIPFEEVLLAVRPNGSDKNVPAQAGWQGFEW